jgi:hypothetical protein
VTNTLAYYDTELIKAEKRFLLEKASRAFPATSALMAK